MREQSPIQWFQSGISDIRLALLRGESLPGCDRCKLMEQHHKVSGRQRQMLKTGITDDRFVKTFLSSSWMPEFVHSQEHNGDTELYPQDWQIDLGNFCNSACTFCTPHSSSRLAVEYKKLGMIENMPPRAWCDDPRQLETFLDALKQCTKLTYLHFIGGETLITPAFRTILWALIEHGLHKSVTVGFTTNLTIWDQEIADLLCRFNQVNVGMSIECFHPLNDYVRYGSKIAQARALATQWIELSQQQQWLTQLRITPTVLSIWHLDSVYEFAAEHGIAVESCNFLDEPKFMRPSVLPGNFRAIVMDKLQRWLDRYPKNDVRPIINTRDPTAHLEQILQDARSYLAYLRDQPDESHRLPDLAKFLSRLESNRNNRILDYLPEYESILRSAGYP
jgi:sulfatase maturation enzyme AslB (radical SAM superfamily)